MKRILFTLLALLMATPLSAQNIIGPLPIAADEECVTAMVGAWPSVSAQISGTWTGTLTFQVSGDGGEFVNAMTVNESTGVSTATTTASGLFSRPVTGFSVFRVCATATMTGTAQVAIHSGRSSGSPRSVVLYDSGGTAVTPLIAATAHAEIDIGVTTAELVALTAGQVIYVTAFSTSIGGATTYKFVAGTGTNCGTGTRDLTGDFNGAKADGSGVGMLFKTNAGEALCMTNSASTVDGYVAYTKF